MRGRALQDCDGGTASATIAAGRDGGPAASTVISRVLVSLVGICTGRWE